MPLWSCMRWCKQTRSMFYFCQSAVSLYSTLIRRFHDKLLNVFFLPLSDKQQSVVESHSIRSAFRRKPLIWMWEPPYVGLRPRSSLWSSRELHEHLWAEGVGVQGRGFEERVKHVRLRLETLSGISCHLLSVQRVKPKRCHLHIFLVESREKSEKHFGGYFKLGMCLFPGLACLALNEIQSLFRQQQIRHN